ncbi:dynactin subunit 6 isoform X2 [Fopius arisanus]|uniref:Dynactin subunit 6 n=1 Tax=Fopius arisanus TaxID=64838 RepID=A0A9R1U6G7_9HYME|nr:PREDICTED: dynactin subunit 6 isoform X2 [Fopius arisanus]
MSEIMSNTPLARRSNVKIAVGAVVCDESILKGDITIGPKTVIHPRASIIAEAGPISIGEGNIIEEMASIINRVPPGGNPDTVRVQTIGNFNVFETDSTCEAERVGDNNVLETKVARGVELTNGCVVGPFCSILDPEIVPENTIVYGTKCQRREMNDKPYPQVGQLEFLIRVLPNYHHLRKPNIKPLKAEPLS